MNSKKTFVKNINTERKNSEKLKKRFAKNINTEREHFEELKAAISKCDAKMLEVSPQQAADLYTYFAQIDEIYVWLKNSYKDDIPVLCNEMRAVFGHLSEYDPTNDSGKKNLDKAHGHSRRLSIDTLKILCNGLDEIFSEWIQKHVSYDYSEKDNAFFPEYVKRYYDAQRGYLEVQKAENLGSDRDNAIVVKYHNVASMYIDLYEYHMSERRNRIEKVAKQIKLKISVTVLATFAFSVLSVIGLFMG